MKYTQCFLTGLAAALLGLGAGTGRAGTYSQNFEALAPNATTFTDGSVLFGNQLGTTTKLLDALYTEIVLTRVGVGGTRAAFLLPDLDPGQRSWGFTARWVGQVYAQFSNPQLCADGFSFTAGQIGALDLAGPGYSQEDGFGTGLTLSARTFYGAGPGFYVFVNGVAVASAPYNLFNAWGDNNPAQRQFEVDWTQADGLTFRVDGLTVFDKVPTPGFIPQAGDRMAWGARTGDKNETVTLDNIVVHTALSPAPTLPLGSSGAAVVSGHSATLSGVVATDAAPVNAWFEWGPTTAYGNATPVQSLAPSLLNSVVGATLGSLSGGTTFHFRLVAQDGVHIFHIFLGPDQSFFVPAFASVSLPGPPRGITGKVTWGDYDGDGDLDFLVVGQDYGSTSAATQLWRNDGAAGFTRVPLPGVAQLYKYGTAVWGDFDNDGDLDFLIRGVVQGGNVTQLWRNDGGDVFTLVPLPGLPNANRDQRDSLTWGDFDNDGALDFLFTSYYGTQLWRNSGAGTFTQVPLPGVPGSGSASGSIAAVDYDRDGNLDFMLATRAGTQLWHNEGGATFTQVPLPGVPGVAAGDVSWGDYDADGDLDFLIAGGGGNNGLAQLWRNDGASGFTQVPLPGVAGIYSGAVKWADFDHDGRLDFLVAGSGSSIQLWHNDGGDSFSSVPLSFTGIYPSFADWGDFDGDGALDLILTQSQAATLLERSLVLTPNLPPVAPAGLGSTVALNGAVTFAWGAASDDHTPALGLSYNLRVGTSPGGGDVVSPMAAADGHRRIVALGNAQSRRFSRLVGLRPGTYYWSVQAIDGAFAGGAFGTEQSFVIAPGKFSFESATATVLESVGTYTVKIVRSGGSENAVTVGYAIDSILFGTLGGSVVFAAGETSKPLTIGIPNNNNLGPNPVVRFFLTFASTGGLQAPTQHTLILTDDDIGVQANQDIGWRTPDRPLKFRLEDLLANDFGTDGLSALMSITSVAAASAGGVSLHQEGDVVVYAPPAGFNSNDSFTYTLTAGAYLSTGKVYVLMNAPPGAVSQNLVSTALGGGGELLVTAAGIPGRSYRLQNTGNLTSPISWTDLGAVQVAPANGQMTFTDPAPATPRFYRVISTAP